jgi:plasmid stability protein
VNPQPEEQAVNHGLAMETEAKNLLDAGLEGKN